MASTIHCNIVSAEREIFSGEATMVIVSGEIGELGVAPSHAPLITRIKPGQVRVLNGDKPEQHFYVSGGILEVQPDLITVLSDTALRAADIDEAKVKAAKEEAERLLAGRGKEMDIAAAQQQLMQAVAQLQALERLRKNLKH
jgi:F-type H+-transporting ATPase subunit epsilon